MGTKYRQDEDLAFLEYCSEEDIKQLASFLIYDAKGKKRVSTQILSDKEFEALNGSPEQWRSSWRLVAGELQHFGGDTVVNVFRREGVLYREILRDTCKRLGVKFDKENETWEIEKKLIEHFIERLWDEMSEEERNSTLKSMNIADFAEGKVDWRSMTPLAWFGGAAAGAWYAWAASAAKFAFAPSNFSRTALTVASSFVAQRGASILLAPAVAVAFTVPALSGTAFRVTVPATIQIAYMRQKYLQKERF